MAVALVRSRLYRTGDPAGFGHGLRGTLRLDPTLLFAGMGGAGEQMELRSAKSVGSSGTVMSEDRESSPGRVFRCRDLSDRTPGIGHLWRRRVDGRILP